MAACGQCGRQNPDGTDFCGFCAAPLNPAGASESQASAKSPRPQPKSPPEFRRPMADSHAVAAAERKGGIEFMPWSELSGGQKAGRVVVLALAAAVVLVAIRGVFEMVSSSRAGGESTSAKQAADAALTAGERKDGIQSLCKVFQIYGVPKTEADADAAAKNAAELFKLPSDQTAERSAVILQAIAREFSRGKLKAADCAAAGEPMPTDSGAAGSPQ
jgi:hypothetical protein